MNVPYGTSIVTRSPLLQPVDVRERREIRRAVARDVDEPVLPGHERALLASRAFLERLVVGAVDEHQVQAHARHAYPPDRLTAGRARAVALRVARDDRSLGRRGRPAIVLRTTRRVCVLRRELVLLPLRVERGERVLPLPDEQCPGSVRRPRRRAAVPRRCSELAASSPPTLPAERRVHGGGCRAT